MNKSLAAAILAGAALLGSGAAGAAQVGWSVSVGVPLAQPVAVVPYGYAPVRRAVAPVAYYAPAPVVYPRAVPYYVQPAYVRPYDAPRPVFYPRHRHGWERDGWRGDDHRGGPRHDDHHGGGHR